MNEGLTGLERHEGEGDFWVNHPFKTKHFQPSGLFNLPNLATHAHCLTEKVLMS